MSQSDWCLGHSNIKGNFESALIVLYVFIYLTSADGLM